MVSTALINFFGIAGTILNLIFIFSPFPSFYQGVKDKEIKNVSLTYLLFLTGNCSLWTIYGIKLDNFTIIFSNIIGLIINIVYIDMYLYIVDKSDKIILNTIGIIAATMLVYIILPVTMIGLIVTFVLLGVYSSMIIKIRETFVKKNAEYTNYFLSIASVFNTSIWSIYGIFILDWVIIIPNIYGVLINIAALIVYYWSVGKIDDSNIFIILLKRALVKEDSNIELLNF
jgi:uncharacterized protein with PQ loop repeat